MSVTLPNMTLILPTLGADRNTWDDKLNAALTKVDSHNHTAGKGVAVPSAGININADLSFGGFGPIALGKAAFSAVTALATGARTLFVNAADGELYWRTNGGVNVKLTSGSSLNISLVGGIAGDYTTAGAELYYDEASKTYRFTSAGSPKLWARVEAGAFRIAKFGTSAAFYASLEVDNAIAANYTLTLPAAVGAGLMQITSGGAVTFSYSLPSNQSLAFVGTGKVNHGDKMLGVAYETLQFGSIGTWSLATPDFNTGQSLGTFSTGGGYGYIDVQGLKPGDRVKQIIVSFTSTGGNPPTIGGYRGTWNSGFTWSTTLSTNTLISGIRYAVINVDTPKAIGIYNPPGGTPATSERLRMRVVAGSNTTVIYDITLIYDSIDTPTYTS